MDWDTYPYFVVQQCSYTYVNTLFVVVSPHIRVFLPEFPSQSGGYRHFGLDCSDNLPIVGV